MYVQVKLSHLLIAVVAALPVVVAARAPLAAPQQFKITEMQYGDVLVRVRPDAATITAGNTKLILSREGNITIQAAKDLHLKAHGSVIISAGEDVQLNAEKDVRLKAGGDVKLNAGDEFKVAADGKSSVETQQLSLTAPKFIWSSTGTALPQFSLPKGLKLETGQGKDCKIDAKGNLELKAGKECKIESGLRLRLKAGTDVDIDANAGVDINAGSTASFRGSSITTIGGSQIKLGNGATRPVAFQGSQVLAGAPPGPGTVLTGCPTVLVP